MRSCSPPARARACAPRGPRCCTPSPAARCSAHVLAAAARRGRARVAVVVGAGCRRGARPRRGARIRTPSIYVQRERLGTAHAVLAARPALARGADDMLVLFADTPLIVPQTLRAAACARSSAGRRRRRARLPAGRPDRLRPAASTQGGELVGDPRGQATPATAERAIDALQRRPDGARAADRAGPARRGSATTTPRANTT